MGILKKRYLFILRSNSVFPILLFTDRKFGIRVVFTLITKIIFSCVKAGCLLNIPLKTADVFNNLMLEIVPSWFKTGEDGAATSCGAADIKSLNKNKIFIQEGS